MPSSPGFSLLDSGLRRNDDEREKVGCQPDNLSAMPAEFLTPSPTVIPAQAGIQWFIQAIPAERE